jgi:hypothetical protein
MDDMMPLEAVMERDLDLMLLEELTVSGLFVDWMMGQIPEYSSQRRAKHVVWHSVSAPELGESDLILRVEDASAQAFALLIENKVDAPPQENQARRYKARGDQGIREGEWSSFRTAIVAPSRYLESDSEAAQYDIKVSYESIRGWFLGRTDNPSRVAYKVGLIDQAIEQNRRGYNPKMDERTTRFFQDYWLLATKKYPELKAVEPGARPASSIWISFKPDGLKRNQRIWHRIDLGQVDLELAFKAGQIEELTTRFSQQLPKDVSIVKRGKSLGLRIEVPTLDRFEDLESQEENVLFAMKSALRLWTLSSVFNGE